MARELSQEEIYKQELNELTAEKVRDIQASIIKNFISKNSDLIEAEVMNIVERIYNLVQNDGKVKEFRYRTNIETNYADCLRAVGCALAKRGFFVEIVYKKFRIFKIKPYLRIRW